MGFSAVERVVGDEPTGRAISAGYRFGRCSAWTVDRLMLHRVAIRDDVVLTVDYWGFHRHPVTALQSQANEVADCAHRRLR
jgi:hypothetical protein